MRLKDINMTADQVKDLTKKYMIETYERYPLVAERAEGMYLYDENGDPWLDFYGGIAVNNAGSCNPAVVAAVRDQVGDIMHTFNYPYTIPQARLSELICTTIGMDKILFQNSGTESNEAMIKMTRKYAYDNWGPEKYEIICAKKSFHGRTYGAMTATGQPVQWEGFAPLVPGFKYAEYNNLKSFEDAITEHTIAIMIETVQGEGGVFPGTQEFIKGLRKLCDDKGIFLLLDEVQAGWGRSGNIMAFMNYGIKPDAVSMAKGMGGGVPIGAVCATAKLASAFGIGSHGSTYAGSPMCCAGSFAEIHEIVDKKLYENSKVVGDYFAAELRKALPHVKEVRNAGLFVGVEFDQPKGLDVKHACVDRKMLTTLIGTSIIRMVPPLIATKEDCDKAVAILKDACEEVFK